VATPPERGGWFGMTASVERGTARRTGNPSPAGRAEGLARRRAHRKTVVAVWAVCTPIECRHQGD
jgi:hypothetical protein